MLLYGTIKAITVNIIGTNVCGILHFPITICECEWLLELVKTLLEPYCVVGALQEV
jgi:hypothetical protein